MKAFIVMLVSILFLLNLVHAGGESKPELVGYDLAKPNDLVISTIVNVYQEEIEYRELFEDEEFPQE